MLALLVFRSKCQISVNTIRFMVGFFWPHTGKYNIKQMVSRSKHYFAKYNFFYIKLLFNIFFNI